MLELDSGKIPFDSSKIWVLFEEYVFLHFIKLSAKNLPLKVIPYRYQTMECDVTVVISLSLLINF